MYARQLEPATAEKAARLNRATLAQFGWAMLRSRGKDVEFRRRIGALALAAEKAGLTPSEQERLDVIGVAAGQHRVAGAAAGDHRRRRGDRRVPHLRPRLRRPAACRPSRPAARCPASTRRCTIDGRRYVDGGMRSAANADLAAGLRPARRPRADPARGRADGQRRRAGDRHGVPGRRRLAGQGQQDGDRQERARPGGAGAVGGGRPRAGGVGRRSGSPRSGTAERTRPPIAVTVRAGVYR